MDAMRCDSMVLRDERNTAKEVERGVECGISECKADAAPQPGLASCVVLLLLDPRLPDLCQILGAASFRSLLSSSHEWHPLRGRAISYLP